jgi:hypothetical protein
LNWGWGEIMAEGRGSGKAPDGAIWVTQGRYF